MGEGISPVDQILLECAEIPVDPDDAELAAVALAIHLEERLGLTMPREMLDHARLVPPTARERSVRKLLGGC